MDITSIDAQSVADQVKPAGSHSGAYAAKKRRKLLQLNGNGASAKPAPGKLRRRLMMLASLDGRTIASRRVASLILAISTDITGGDHDVLSEGQRQLIQRAAMLGTLIESYEAEWLAGEVIDLPTYFAAINSQRRILETLQCLERRARDVTPLRDILAKLDREAVTETETVE